MPTRPKLIRVHRCIYKQEDAKVFFHSVRLPGKSFPTKRKLAATTLRAAIAEVETLNTRRREAQIGAGIDPYSELITVAQIAKEWQERGCPGRDGLARAGKSLDTELARLKRLLPFWGAKVAREIVPVEDCPEYHKHRLAQRSRQQFRLGRSVDAELTTLSSLLAWAAQNPRKTGLRYNPLAQRKRFDNPKLVRHCTEVMPQSDEQFHQLAAFLLSSQRSRTLGWQMLLEGLTGARTSEILACRVDAAVSGQPGFMDHHALHLHRCKDGIEPWALLECAEDHSPLRDCLQAFLNWHDTEARKSPWFIPGHPLNKVADRCSLTHALRRACAVLDIPLVTSHGMRAYHVAGLRSMGIADDEIAARLGHRSTQQVEDTYGTVKPGFRGSWQLDFLPEDTAPAWAAWTPKVAYQKLIVPEPKRTNLPKPESKGGSGQSAMKSTEKHKSATQ